LAAAVMAITRQGAVSGPLLADLFTGNNSADATKNAPRLRSPFHRGPPECVP